MLCTRSRGGRCSICSMTSPELMGLIISENPAWASWRLVMSVGRAWQIVPLRVDDHRHAAESAGQAGLAQVECRKFLFGPEKGASIREPYLMVHPPPESWLLFCERGGITFNQCLHGGERIRKRTNHSCQTDRASLGGAPFIGTDTFEPNSAVSNLEVQFDGSIAAVGNPVIGNPKPSANLGPCERADRM
jgi:hypothetical protein